MRARASSGKGWTRRCRKGRDGANTGNEEVLEERTQVIVKSGIRQAVRKPHKEGLEGRTYAILREVAWCGPAGCVGFEGRKQAIMKEECR